MIFADSSEANSFELIRKLLYLAPLELAYPADLVSTIALGGLPALLGHRAHPRAFTELRIVPPEARMLYENRFGRRHACLLT